MPQQLHAWQVFRGSRVGQLVLDLNTSTHRIYSNLQQLGDAAQELLPGPTPRQEVRRAVGAAQQRLEGMYQVRGVWMPLCSLPHPT
jgi:hypothetical protein